MLRTRGSAPGLRAARTDGAREPALGGAHAQRSCDALIELTHCSLILGGRPVLDDVTLTLRRGERWALLGPNGAGKTMLLKMLRGDVWPTPTGRERRRYRLGGEDSQQPRDLKHLIAYVGPERQDKYVRYGWDLRVAEVVATGLFDEDIPLTKPTSVQRARVARVLKRFGLWSLRRRRILSLSYGQRRLALLARAFVSSADVLLLDEPFNGLDAHVKRKLRAALERRQRGRTWVLTSHREHELPSNLTHRARIEHSRLTASPLTPPQRGGRERKPLSTSREHALSGAPICSATISVASLAQRGKVREGAASQWLVRIRGANLYRDYRPVIRDLDWTIRYGEHWAVFGANGSGKSTLLSMIYGDLHPALGGTIERAGVARGARIEEWKRRVGWMSPELQAAHVQALSIEDIVISGRYASVGLNQAPTRADRVAARRCLEFFGLASLRDRDVRQVSYGQLRLALIARAVVNDPELLLLDEPCAGLDAETRSYVLASIEQLAARGVQIIIAVHDREDLPRAITHVLQIGRSGKVRLREAGVSG